MRNNVIASCMAMLSISALVGCSSNVEPPNDMAISLLAIPGVAAPVPRMIPVRNLDSSQYTGTINWSPMNSGVFAASATYSAEITLTPKAGYTFEGVAANTFTVDGAVSVAHSTNSGVVNAIFSYADASYVLFSNTKLDVFLKSDGDYVLSYYDDAGNLLVSATVTPNNTPQDLFTAGGTTKVLEVQADNTIKLSEMSGSGYHQYLIAATGLTIEMDSTAGTLDTYLRFVDQASGSYKYSAIIQAGTPTYRIHFLGGALPDVNIVQSLNDDENIYTYDTNTGFAVGEKTWFVKFQAEHYHIANIREGYLLNNASYNS
jgi:hypothetical protein